MTESDRRTVVDALTQALAVLGERRVEECVCPGCSATFTRMVKPGPKPFCSTTCRDQTYRTRRTAQ